MYKEDFTNWTPERCKEKIHLWQKTRDKALFDVLLAKYDRYLLKISWEYQKRLREETLRDLYHTSIAGFGTALLKFKFGAPSKLIIAVIKAYVRREIENKYITKKTETPNEGEGGDFDAKLLNREDLLDIYSVVNSDFVTGIERELICLRFEDNLSTQEIGVRLGMSRQRVSRKLDKIIAKIRKRILEDGK